MPIQVEIPDDFFSAGQKDNLKALFDANTEPEFSTALNKVLLAALKEYRDMFLGMGLPSRVNEIREFRLFYLIKHYFDNRIPDELEVSRMFQLPETRAKSLILYVITRFRYELENEIANTLITIVNSAEALDGEYRVIISSENMVEELDRIIRSRGIQLKKLARVRDEPSMYSITADSYNAVKAELGL